MLGITTSSNDFWVSRLPQNVIDILCNTRFILSIKFLGQNAKFGFEIVHIANLNFPLNFTDDFERDDGIANFLFECFVSHSL